MAKFMKCCLPSVHVDDDEAELVSIDAIHPKRSRHNDRLKANISRPMPQRVPKIQVPLPVANPRNPYPTMRRRPLEDLQDLVDDHGEPRQDNISAVAPKTRDRAYGHVLRDLNAALRHSKWAVSGSFAEAHNVHIMYHTFWQPFTAAYPDAPVVFAQCGLPLPKTGRIVTTQPPQQRMQMPFERPNAFQKPRTAPNPPRTTSDQGRSLTAPTSKHRSYTRSSSSSRPSSHSKSSSKSSSSSKRSSSSKTTASFRHKKASSSSSSKSRHASSSGSKLNTPVYHSTKDEIPDALLSPKRPVHPANILAPTPKPRSKFSAFLGLGDSPEEIERQHLEQLEQNREARRAEKALAAKIQRNRVRDREREWHTRKQSERMAKESTWPGF